MVSALTAACRSMVGQGQAADTADHSPHDPRANALILERRGSIVSKDEFTVGFPRTRGAKHWPF